MQQALIIVLESANHMRQSSVPIHVVGSVCKCNGDLLQALTRSDSESSQEALAQEAAPVLYRLRADGRRVPITDGHGVELARRKGLIQEVEVSPKRASLGQNGASSAFGEPQTSQPETVVLHSVELPQIQLGDREIADSPPERVGDEEAVSNAGKLTKSLNLNSHPSLLLLQQQQQQQQRQQSQTNKLMTECGLEPRSDSSHTTRSSQSLSSSQAPHVMPDSGMSSFQPVASPAQEVAGDRAGLVTASLSAGAMQPGYMPWCGMTNSSAPLPNQAAALAQASRSLSLGQSPAMGHYMAGAPVPLGRPGIPHEAFVQVRQPCEA